MQIIPFSAFGKFLAKDVFKTAVVLVWGGVGDGGELYIRILLEGMGAAWGILGKPSCHAATMD